MDTYCKTNFTNQYPLAPNSCLTKLNYSVSLKHRCLAVVLGGKQGDTLLKKQGIRPVAR